MGKTYTFKVGSKPPVEFNNLEQLAVMNAFHNSPFVDVYWVVPNITRNRGKGIFKKGKAKIGFYQGKYISSFVWQIGKEQFETPFDINKIPLEELVIPYIQDDEFLLIRFLVIDSATNTLMALRGFTLSLGQTKRFMKKIEQQFIGEEYVDPISAQFYTLEHLSIPFKEIVRKANMEKIPSTH